MGLRPSFIQDDSSDSSSSTTKAPSSCYRDPPPLAEPSEKAPLSSSQEDDGLKRKMKSKDKTNQIPFNPPLVNIAKALSQREVKI